jgi:hypothetical protein
MTTRTTRKTVTFRRPFCLSAADEVLPPGTYAVDTDEELIDGLSFLAYRCIATLLHLPCISNRGVSEVVVIDPSPDQIPQAAIDLWPPHPISRFPTPEHFEASAMPSQDGLRLNQLGPRQEGSARVESSIQATRDHCREGEDEVEPAAKRW